MKNLLTIGLVALALLGAGVAVWKRSSARAEPAGPPAAALPADGVVVTYFTTNVRCASCLKIEKLTRETVAKHFPAESAAGGLVFRVINTDEPGNKHFLNDYQLVSKTVIVSVRKDGQETGWKNLQDVWLKLADPAAFDAYVRGAIGSALGQPPA